LEQEGRLIPVESEIGGCQLGEEPPGSKIGNRDSGLTPRGEDYLNLTL
jgi:hypothetical protein